MAGGEWFTVRKHTPVGEDEAEVRAQRDVDPSSLVDARAWRCHVAVPSVSMDTMFC